MKGHDYTEPGYYFITVCVQNRECLLGDVTGGQMAANDWGRFVDRRIRVCCLGQPHIFVDTHVVMPNHIHVVFGVVAVDVEGAKHSRTGEDRSSDHESANAWPLQGSVGSRGTRRGSVCAIVQNLKSVTGRRINSMRSTPGVRFWQRDFHDHIVRTEQELDRIRKYIRENPARWAEDHENPANHP